MLSYAEMKNIRSNNYFNYDRTIRADLIVGSHNNISSNEKMVVQEYAVTCPLFVRYPDKNITLIKQNCLMQVSLKRCNYAGFCKSYMYRTYICDGSSPTVGARFQALRWRRYVVSELLLYPVFTVRSLFGLYFFDFVKTKRS